MKNNWILIDISLIQWKIILDIAIIPFVSWMNTSEQFKIT